MARIIVPLVGKAHRNPCAIEGPQFLDQPVIKFLRPFAGEKLHDLRATLGKFGAVAPLAVLGVDQRNPLRVT